MIVLCGIILNTKTTTTKNQHRTHPRVKDLSSAPNAHVPIMSFSLDGVEFDALFAQLPLPSVKVTFNLHNVHVH